MSVSESPQQLQSVRAHRGEVACADAFGARLVTGGNKALRLWAWGAGAGWEQCAEVAAAHRYGVTAVRWSPRGQLVASGGVDGVVRVWARAALAPRRVLAAPGAGAVRTLCWAGVGVVCAAHDDGVVCVWRVGAGALMARLQSHEEAVHALAAPRDTLLLTCCSTGVLKVFDLPDVCRCYASNSPAPAALVWEDGAHDLGALCADASMDGRAVATGGQDARVRVWRVELVEGRRALRAASALEGHSAGVTALRWGEGGVLASASLDRTARVWQRDACVCVLRAHARYLTCVALAPDLRYMITGSNDRTVRMWSLGTLTLDDELEPPCDAGAHFGLGDLEGIEPVETDDLLEPMMNGKIEASEENGDESEESGGARRVWSSSSVHTGAVNCISTHGDLLATASSDGTVRIMCWNEALQMLVEERVVGAEGATERGYPVLGADLGAGGALLLSAGLDGSASLTDVQTGLTLRTLSSPCGEEGAGGVRGARVSAHRPPLLLLATDTGSAPLWSLADPDPQPIHVYGGHEAAALCCAWGGLRVCATGGEGGELRIHAAPPAPRTLHHEANAHDLGVQSCDFAPSSSAVGLRDEDQLLLATAGCDDLVKLWLIDLDEEWGEDSTVQVQVVRAVEAHRGGVTSVRWGTGAGARGVLASGGADRWGRAWRVASGGALVRPAGAVPTQGAVSVALLGRDLLVLGTMTGELAVWQLPRWEGLGDGESTSDLGEDVDEEEADVLWWGESSVVRWMKEHVTRAPGSTISREEETQLVTAVRAAHVSGARLLDAPVYELLAELGFDADSAEEEGRESELWTRLCEELRWLRSAAPRAALEWSAPHGLLCPLTHRVLVAPVCAADGFTYERTALHEWFLASEGLVSPVSGRRMHNARVCPNHKLTALLRAFLQEHEADE